MEEPESTPPPEPEPPHPRERGFFGRLFRRRVPAPVIVNEEPAPVVEEPVAEEPVAEEPAVPDEPDHPGTQDFQAVLDEVLDALGSAHHRPFSRG